MKRILALLLIFFSFSFFIPTAKAQNTVQLYFFHGDGCPHCSHEKEFLQELKEKFPNLVINSYEVWYDQNNAEKMEKVASYMDKTVSGVPFTIVGEKTFSGYSDSTGKAIEEAVTYYSENGFEDHLKDVMSGKIPATPPQKEPGEDTPPISEKKEEQKPDEKLVFDLPFVGSVNASSLSLPILAVVLGTLDGFNPCAMWILLFLISMLLGMKNKKRMWTLGLTFLGTSAIVYLLFMISWLNFAKYIGTISIVRTIIALIALIGGAINFYSYFKEKDNGCHVVEDKKRKKIFERIKAFTGEKKFIFALLGIMALAVSVNFIELACSAGLPLLFTQVLAMNDLSNVQYGFYIFLYLLFFLIDDLVVFFIAMKTLKITGVSTKFGKLSHLIGGILMMLIGILLFVKPEWLMFQF